MSFLKRNIKQGKRRRKQETKDLDKPPCLLVLNINLHAQSYPVPESALKKMWTIVEIPLSFTKVEGSVCGELAGEYIKTLVHYLIYQRLESWASAHSVNCDLISGLPRLSILSEWLSQFLTLMPLHFWGWNMTLNLNSLGYGHNLLPGLYQYCLSSGPLISVTPEIRDLSSLITPTSIYDLAFCHLFGLEK